VKEPFLNQARLRHRKSGCWM